MNPQQVRIMRTAAVIIALFAVIWVIGMGTRCISGRSRVSGNSYDGKMDALRNTDPKLLMYREGKQIPTGLQKPKGIALDKDGRIYVAGDYAIRVFHANGSSRLDIRTSAVPYCLAVAEDGTIYAGMQDHVEVFNPKGKRTAVWNSAGKRACFTSIAVTSKDVLVADAGNRVALRYSLEGQGIGVLAAKDPAKNAPGLVVPSPYLDAASAVGSGFWISNPGRHQIELYDSDGRMKRAWGKHSFAIDGFSGCCNPTHFAVCPDGRFVTSEKGLPRVKVYSPSGKFEGVVAGREAFSPDASGLDIAVDSQGRILVLDPATRSVRVFVSKGKAKQ